MFCTKCGNQIQGGDVFCGNCGQKAGAIQATENPQPGNSLKDSANLQTVNQPASAAQPSQSPGSPSEYLNTPGQNASPQPANSAPQFDFDYQSQSPTSLGPQGTEILTLDTHSLFKAVEKAHTVITSYLNAKIENETYQGIKNWCDHVQVLKRTGVSVGDPEDYGSSEEDIEVYNIEKNCCLIGFIGKGKFCLVFGAPGASTPDGKPWTALDRAKAFIHEALKPENLPTDLQNAENELRNVEKNLTGEIEAIRMIPPAYRSPTALKTIMFYLGNLRAATWAEATAQFDMQISMWKTNDANEFLEMKGECYYLMDTAIGNPAISSDLFSGLSHFAP